MHAKHLANIYIATDAEEVKSIAQSWGAQILMTNPDCRSGTERLAECLNSIDGELIVNVQGDEPLIDPAMIDALVERWQQTRPDLITPVFRITVVDDISNPNVVKVARSASGEALYFSRSAIPYIRDLPVTQWLDKHTFWGHIGVYGYRRDVLEHYPALPVSPLESAEQLEQLRFLNAGYRFQTFETSYRPIAVDVAADLERARAILEHA